MSERNLLIIHYLLYFTIFYVCHGQTDPCIEHTTISDPTRSVYYEKEPGDKRCDRSLERGWYKFDGDFKIPTRTPAYSQCGTISPIWVNDTYPEINEEKKIITVCKVSFLDACFETWTIEVKKCGTYYVFDLKPIEMCEGRYCVDGPERCADEYMSETGYAPCTAISLNITGKTEVTGFIPTYDPFSPERILNLKCECEINDYNGHNPDEIMWDVVWYRDDVKVKEINNINFNEIQVTGLLKSSEWINSGKKMGFEALCAIRGISNVSGAVSNFIKGHSKFIGIQVSPTRLQISSLSGGTENVSIQTTVPIACAGQFDCDLRIELFDFQEQFINEPMFCNESILEYTKPSLCGLNFNGWDREPQNITISVPVGSESNQDYTALVKLRSTGLTFDLLWKDYHLPPIIIDVLNEGVESIKDPYCYTNSDPWYRTFDKLFYSYQDEGEFLLFRHTEKPIEVHTIQRKYDPAHSWVENCGAAIRAGGDVFIVYGCGKPTRWIVRRLCNSNAAYLTVYKRWKSYEVHLPTGTIVRVSEFLGRGLDVTIYLSQLDRGKTEGICGNSNGLYGDDNIGRDGVMYNWNEDGRHMLASTWSVLPADSLFVVKSRDKILNTSFMYCSCSGSTISEDVLSPNVDCSWKDGVPVCPPINWEHEPCRIRTSRSIDDNDDFIIDVPEDIVRYSKSENHNNNWKNGWTEESATESCMTEFDKSPAFEICLSKTYRNISIELQICVNNIRISGGTTFTQDIVESVIAVCSIEIRVNTTLAASTDESGDTLVEAISKRLCPNDCSQNGVKNGDCVEGFCVCYPELTGDNCQVNMSAPPLVAGLSDEMICDTSKRGCNSVSIFGSGFYPNAILKCRGRQAKIGNGRIEPIGDPTFTDADYKNPGEIRCTVTPNRRRRSIDSSSSETAILLSVSSNGIDYSDEVPVVLFDSSCTSCYVEDGNVVCEQKDVCVVDGRCFSSLNEKCQSSKDANKPFWIIGAVFGLVAVIVAISILAISCHQAKKISVLPPCMNRKDNQPYKLGDTELCRDYSNFSLGFSSPVPPHDTTYKN